MKIRAIRVRNLRNLICCDAENLPNLVVIAGANGVGKSSFLEAIILWKQFMVSYTTRNWLSQVDLINLVTKEADFATIEVETQIEEQDIEYLRRLGLTNLPNTSFSETSKITIRSNGSVESQAANTNIYQYLLRYPNRDKFPYAPIFDYYGPNRYLPPKDFITFDVNNMSTQAEEMRRIQPSKQLELKSDTLKDYLYSLYQKDAEWFVNKRKELNGVGTINLAEAPDSFNDVRKIVNYLLPHITFEKVTLNSPIEFLFKVSSEKLVELDFLSSGEKAVLALFLEIYRTQAKNSIIMMDEPELHLNQAVESRIIPYLLENVVGDNNQVFVVSHSPGILSTAPSEYVFRINSYTDDHNHNQFVAITSEQERMDTLRALVGNLGVFTTSSRFVFLEGTSSSKSIDKTVLETLFPQLRGEVTFIPGDSCEVVEVVSKKVSQILSNGIPFGDFYAIRDRDRLSEEEITRKEREVSNLKVWSRCMIENYLLEPTTWSRTLELIGLKCEISTVRDTFVSAALNLKSAEIDLRLDEKLRSSLVMKDFRNSAEFSTENKLDKLKTQIDGLKQNLVQIRSKIELQVEGELSDGSFIYFFHGKALLKEIKRLLNIEINNDYFIPILLNKMRELNTIPEDMKETINTLIPGIVL